MSSRHVGGLLTEPATNAFESVEKPFAAVADFATSTAQSPAESDPARSLEERFLQGPSTLDDLVRGVGQEGLSGIFDAPGAIDRQRKQRELDKNFEVVPADFMGISRTRSLKTSGT